MLQVIDDSASRTLVAASSLSPDVKPELEDGNGATVVSAGRLGSDSAALGMSDWLVLAAWVWRSWKFACACL